MQALVDNSTLTAVQRLTGDIPVTEMFPVEGDVSAFDQYLQALLFYDEVAVIDDYKEDFKAERKNRFKEAVFISPADLQYSEILAAAESETKDIYLSVSGGQVDANPMGEFLSALDLHVSPAWYMQSSAWFLKLRLLADEADVNLPKYGTLMTSIFGQLNQNKRSNIPPNWSRGLRDSEGREVVNRPKKNASQMGPVNGDVSAFAAGLNWLALRSCFYFYTSLRLGTACVLHPIRHSYLAQYILRRYPDAVAPSIQRSVLDFVSAEAMATVEASDSILGHGATQVRVPFFAGWAVARAGTPKSGYEHVLQVRGSKEALNFRSRLRELEQLAAGEDFIRLRSEAAKLRAAVVADLNALKAQFGGASTTDKVGLSVNLLTLSPSISSTAMSEGLRRLIPSRHRRAAALLRSMTADIMSIPSLGHIADCFRRSRREVENTEFFGTFPRVEAKRFRRSSSGWKQPL